MAEDNHFDAWEPYDDEDFREELYLLSQTNEEQLRSGWRVFTKIKDAIHKGRRLENASWRLWHKERNATGKSPTDSTMESALSQLDSSFSKTLDLTTQVGDLIYGAAGTAKDKESVFTETDALTEEALFARKLHNWKVDNKVSNGALQQLLETMQACPDINLADIPASVKGLKALAARAAEKPRPRCAVFSHSLQRNGANNFILYVLRKLVGDQQFELFSPKPGPMSEDFEAIGVKVHIMDATADSYIADVRKELAARFGMVFCNTIMRAEVVEVAQELGLPHVWVIHEAWPQDQFEYYAKEVFLMAHIDGNCIRRAFSKVSAVVFPAHIQKSLYDGLFPPEVGNVIYNGIPLASLNAFRAARNRDAERASLGYGPSDFLVLHLGTVCKRKAQLSTAKAFSKLVTEHGVQNAKLLMVGARYIRDHEIAYIDEIKAEIAGAGLEDRFQLMDIQKEVLRFYLAADVVVVPSINEVLPLVICEAMAFERPVIASRIDGIPEAMDDGVEGFLIDAGNPEQLADRINRLYTDTDLRVRMGNAGRNRVLRQFAYDVMGKAYRQLMDNAFDAAHGGATSDKAKLTPASSAESDDSDDPTVVLVDMDSTIVDFDGAWLARWQELGHSQPGDDELVRSRKHYELELNFSADRRDAVVETIASPGLFLSMKPYDGAIQALKEMRDSGIDVRILTAPHPSCFAACASEKYQWVAEHLGEDWLPRLILARDKTHVRGRYLIDDKPKISGSSDATWDHVVFTQSYNQTVATNRRMNSWADWRSLVEKQ